MGSPLYDVLGLPLETALTLLKAYGICAPDVRFTQAPEGKAGGKKPDDKKTDEARPGEKKADEVREPRVVALREDGHVVICSLFATGDPD